eukprot:Phypoly_transcript_07428.p1 GENE.Phypoly_transcript_07428~~Phypoly_transcript_07428.p1  ORF type:complete len:444 (+),score=108.09 Phypoly_transcript_07428:147-1478(+)
MAYPHVYLLALVKSHGDGVRGTMLLHASCYWLLFVCLVCCISFLLKKMHQQQRYAQIDLEVSVLSGDQLMFQSMKCEPPETPPERSAGGNMGNPNSPSAGLLMTGYKVPEATNNWKAEVKRIWNKPVEQLPIGIDLPRLANSIFVPSLSNDPLPPALTTPTHPTASTSSATPATAPTTSTTESAAPAAPVAENAAPAAPAATEAAAPAPAAEPTPAPTPATNTTPPAEPMDVTPTTAPHANGADTAHAEAPAAPPAAQDDEIDTRAREIMQTLYTMGRFIEGDEYAQKLAENFGSYVVLEGAKDRDMSREIARLISEYLGKDSRMVRVLKACNQAIIAPAVIELTLNVCAKVPFKDAGGWRMEITKNAEGAITVTHVKQQRQRSSNKEEEFTFEWHLEIIFDEDLTSLADVFLSIPKLNFGPAVSQTTMEGIQYTFAPYLVRR